MLAARVFSIVFPIFAIIAAGFAYGRWKRPDLSAANQINMNVLVPALLIDVLSRRDFALGDYGSLALGAALVVLGSGLLALPVAWAVRVSPKTLVPPMMFTNSGNMGLPLALLAFGEPALAAAVVLFIVEMGLHFTLGTYLMDRRARLAGVARQPIVIATLAGIVMSVAGWRLPAPLAAAVAMLGQASIPLLLFSLGARLTSVDLRDWRIGALGAVLCPLTGIAMVLVLQPWLALAPEQQALLLVFGALPPAVLNYLVAEQYHQEPARVASIVMLGTLASVISIPAVLGFALG